MIPVTTSAGRKVALFGLGGSGLASASALLAGGADVIAWDDNPDTVIKATSAGIPTADLRHIDWSRISALVLAPGRLEHALIACCWALMTCAAVRPIWAITELTCSGEQLVSSRFCARRYH